MQARRDSPNARNYGCTRPERIDPVEPVAVSGDGQLVLIGSSTTTTTSIVRALSNALAGRREP
jgi:hypothetical protein